MPISKEIAITKEMLIDWLREEVPDGPEMGIVVGPDGQWIWSHSLVKINTH